MVPSACTELLLQKARFSLSFETSKNKKQEFGNQCNHGVWRAGRGELDRQLRLVLLEAWSGLDGEMAIASRYLGRSVRPSLNA